MPSKMNREDKPKLWKDHVDRASLERFARSLAQVYPTFNTSGFVAACIGDQFDHLELKARLASLGRRLRDFLPDDYTQAVDILIAAAPHANGFENWILTSYVEQFGLDHLQDSVRAMKELTKHGSAEFCVRPFIIKHEPEMLRVLAGWASDSNEHVRRLAAEGSRPRGVWTLHIDSFKKNPAPVLAILEKLKADPSFYVRKAVANNLNDISKDHPKQVLKTALVWNKTGRPETNWIIKHACRSLIKKGYPEVFGLLGFSYPPKLELAKLSVAPATVRIGQSAAIKFELKSRAKSAQKLAIDYRITYATGKPRVSSRVFKLAEKSLKPGERLVISSKHPFRETSGRKHSPGKHGLEIIVNGQVLGRRQVSLTR